MSRTSSYTYETVYILSPTLSEDDAAALHQKIDNVIAHFNGKVIVRDDWGIVELAYTIRKHKNGRFVVVNYTGNAGVVEEIERHFKIISDVMRFMTVVLDKDYNYTKARKFIRASEEEWTKNRELKSEKGYRRQAPRQNFE